MLLLGLLRFCGRRDRGRLRDGRASAAAFKRSASASDTNANPFPINASALPHDELMTSSPRFDICQCGRGSRDRGFEHFYDGLESNDSALRVLGDDTLRMIARGLGVGGAPERHHRLEHPRERRGRKCGVLVKRILGKYG